MSINKFGQATNNTIIAQTSASNYKLIRPHTADGSHDFENLKLSNVKEPTLPSDAATKAYADRIYEILNQSSATQHEAIIKINQYLDTHRNDFKQTSANLKELQRNLGNHILKVGEITSNNILQLNQLEIALKTKLEKLIKRIDVIETRYETSSAAANQYGPWEQTVLKAEALPSKTPTHDNAFVTYKYKTPSTSNTNN